MTEETHDVMQARAMAQADRLNRKLGQLLQREQPCPAAIVITFGRTVGLMGASMPGTLEPLLQALRATAEMQAQHSTGQAAAE